MPESSYEIHPFFTAVGSGRAAEKTVAARECGIQQGDQVVLEHGLNLGILLVTADSSLSASAGYSPPESIVAA